MGSSFSIAASSSLIAPASSSRRATQSYRRLPDRLDPVETFVAALRAEYITEQATEKACIFLERDIFLGRSVHRSISLGGYADCNEFATGSQSIILAKF